MNQKYILLFVLLQVFVSRMLSADLYDFSNPGASLSNADYQFVGESAGNYSSYAISTAGDVDGDGLDDILVGAHSNSDGGANAGKSYLFLGATLASSGTGTLNLSSADYQFVGENAGDASGMALAGGADVDGDGLSDILIAASANDDNGGNAGKTYLILGSTLASLGAGSHSLSVADYHFVGENAGDGSGRSVAFAGDVDGDGRDDILIGALFNDDSDSDAGKTYLILATSLGGSGTVSLSSSDYEILGEGPQDWSGESVGSAGDVDGDGLGDILIGAPGNDDGGTDSGNSYLFYGASIVSSASSSISLTSADVSFLGVVGDGTGTATVGAGDVDGDGYDDVLIGAYANDEGRAYLVLGSTIRTLSGDFDLSSSDYELVGENLSDQCGESVSGAGDVDGDGLADLLIGARTNNDAGFIAGKAYVVLGSSIGGSGSVDLSTADYLFTAENAGDYAGGSVSTAGDVDGDGLSDILVGAYLNDEGGGAAGKTYLVVAQNECDPDDAIYVDAYSGTSSGPGGTECPYDTIQGGIDAAVTSGLSRVIVRGGFYYEDVVLDSGIELVGELRWGFWPAFIVNSGSSTYLVEGANNAALQNFIVYEGGIHLDGINGMTIQENVVYNHTNVYIPDLALENGASDHVIRNNIFYKHHFGGMAVAYPQYVIYLGQNSDDNQFINNTIHSRDYYGIGIYRDVIGVYLEDYTEENEFRNNIIDTITHYSTAGVRYGFYTTGTHVTGTFDYNKTPLNNLGVTMGTGNLVMSRIPEFASPMPYGFNYTLQSTSVCINAGDPDSAYNDPDGTRNDMGAFGGPDFLDFQ